MLFRSMFFGECRITHEPGEESLGGVGCFPVSPSIQVISEILESLLIPIGLLQPLYNLFLVFFGDIPQDCPGTMHLTHLPGRTEEGGFRYLLDADMTSWTPVSPRSLRFSKSPDQNSSFSQSVILAPRISR